MGIAKKFVEKFYRYEATVVCGSAKQIEDKGNEINKSDTENITFIVPLGINPNGDLCVYFQTRKEVK